MTSSSPDNFDPYLEWLGIARGERPADHYRLLGLPRFEPDPDRIEAAAYERMSLVRKHQTGPRAILTQPLLTELAAARNCLMGAESKRLYDEQLQPIRSAPVARVVAAAAGATVDPPIARPSSLAAADDEQNIEPRSSLGSQLILFFATTAAVVLVAGGTFALGRRYWSELPTPPKTNNSATDPNRLTSEQNPEEESAKQKPSRSRHPAKTAAVVVMQEGSGDINLTPATAVLSGGVKLMPAGSRELLGGWSHPGDEASWTFNVIRPGFFQLEVSYAASAEAGESQILVQLDGQEIKTLALPPTGSLDKWSVKQQTVAMTAAGQHRLLLTLDSEMEAGTLELRLVHLTPTSNESKESK